MIVYRIQSYPDTDHWCNEYLPTIVKAQEVLARSTDANIPARLDQLEITCVTGNRDRMCDFLNALTNNHMAQDPSGFLERNY